MSHAADHSGCPSLSPGTPIVKVATIFEPNRRTIQHHAIAVPYRTSSPTKRIHQSLNRPRNGPRLDRRSLLWRPTTRCGRIPSVTGKSLILARNTWWYGFRRSYAPGCSKVASLRMASACGCSAAHHCMQASEHERQAVRATGRRH